MRPPRAGVGGVVGGSGQPPYAGPGGWPLVLGCSRTVPSWHSSSSSLYES